MRTKITKKLLVALCATMLCGACVSVTSAEQGAYSASPSFGLEGNTNTDYTYDEDGWTDEESKDYITVNPEETLEEIYANCPEGYEVKFIAWVNLETKTEGRSYYYSKVSTPTGDVDSSFDEGSVEPAIADEAGTDMIVKNDDSGISDTKLYEVLLSQVDENKDGLLQLSELKQTKKINLSDKEITDISGLEYFVNLEDLVLDSLDIENEQLKVISKLTQINELTLRNMDIDDISFLADLNNLQDLSIYRTYVSNLSALTNMTNLKYLTLDYNKIVDLSPLSGLENLEYLSLINNKIMKISPLATLKNLRTLELGKNIIHDISPVYGLHNLKKLEAQSNKIEFFSGETNLESLSELSLGDNKITDISAIRSCPNLKICYLCFNEITDISPFSGLESFEYIDLSNNNIGKLPEDFKEPSTMKVYKEPSSTNSCELPRPCFDLRDNKITKAEARRKFSDELLDSTMKASTYTWFEWQNFIDDIKGDMDGDLTVSLNDVTKILKTTLGIEDIQSFEVDIADINEDGELTLADAQLVLKLALGCE